MKNSKIEWTDHTFNPWIGCTKVDELCAHCYAETLMDTRYGRVQWGKGKPRSRTSPANWKLPLTWNRQSSIDRGSEVLTTGYKISRQRVFCASLSDWLDHEVPIEWLADLLELIHDTPNLDWLLLTKRPENWKSRTEAALSTFPMQHGMRIWLLKWITGEAPENIFIGTSVGTQKSADIRIPELLKIPAKIRFLSLEPMLESVNLVKGAGHSLSGDEKNPRSINFRKSSGNGIRWVICGGESGLGARPMHPDWARQLRDQCLAAGIPFFFKQWGEWLPENDNFAPFERGTPSSAFHTFSDGNKMNRVGKKAAGRMLDGREWNQFPE